MYAALIDQTIGRGYQKGVANKILQSMDRIRNEFDPVQARRWPTELLQNARDLAWPDRPVRVQIELTDDALYFRHIGEFPFPGGTQQPVSAAQRAPQRHLSGGA